MVKIAKKILYKLLISLFIITLCISLFFIIKYYYESKKNKDIQEELIEDVITTGVSTDTDTNIIKIDWVTLKQINEDIVGWITIEDTNINYPILKSSFDFYYLNHSYDKSKNSNGSIFVTNTSLFQDEEIYIYGHNMKNGSMFASLKNYMNNDFYKNHLKVNIYTPEYNYKGKIFSVYTNDAFNEENIIKELDFKSKIDYYNLKNRYSNDIDVNNTLKIVKLVTCSYERSGTNSTEQRYYIIASLKII